MTDAIFLPIVKALEMSFYITKSRTLLGVPVDAALRMSTQAASRLAGQSEREPIACLHAFLALQITVEWNVRTLILRDFILTTTCLEEKHRTYKH